MVKFLPFYTPNAFDYWNYYSVYLKGIRFSKRDFIAELLYLSGHSISADNGNQLADIVIEQNKRLVYTVRSSGVYWDSVNRTHEAFLSSIRDFKSKDSLLDVLQETRRCKVKEVTRFCHKLIRYVREFILKKRKFLKDLILIKAHQILKLIIKSTQIFHLLSYLKN